MNKPAARLKTRLLTVITILSSVLGNFSLSWGLKARGAVLLASPLAYLEALFQPWVALGVTLLMLWLLSRMALLSWADLSYVLPVTSAGYVLNAIISKVFLLEEISYGRWAGTLLIVAGVALVSATPSTTTNRGKERRGA